MISIRCLSLAERAAFLNPNYDEVRESASERIRWWAERHFAGDQGAMNRWMTACGADPSRAVYDVEWADFLNSAQTDDLVNRAPWARCLVEAMTNFNASHRPAEVGLGPAAVAVPFLSWAEDRLNGSDVFERPAISRQRQFLVSEMLKWLRQCLASFSRPTVALALNLGRIQGLLEGETSEQRAETFYARLQDPRHRAGHISGFPVLDRILSTFTCNAVTAFLELFDRVSDDEEQIRGNFDLENFEITRLELGKGDPHQGSRCVAILWFDEKRIVYKPHTMGPEKAFGEALRFLGLELGFDFDRLTVIERGDYAWTNFISPDECQSELEVHEAYRRMGNLLSALLVCGCTDIHFENLIFSGTCPVAIDLETLLAPLRRIPDLSQRAAHAARHRTLLSSHYLPTGGQRGGGADISAGGLDGPSEHLEVTVINGLDRDDARAEAKRVVIAPISNTPRLKGAVQPARTYLDDLIAGFCEGYEVWRKHKAVLCAPGGPLFALRKTRLRWVARGTAIYGHLMASARQPTALRDGVDFEMAFAPLWRLNSHDSEQHAPQVAAEVADMWRLDVPYFAFDSDSRSAIDSSGRSLLDVFADVPWNTLKARVRGLSRQDCKLQADVIRGAFLAKSLSHGPVHPRTGLSLKGPMRWSKASISAEVDLIAEQLLVSAHISEGLPYWLTVSSASVSHHVAKLTDSALYDGAAGIGVFFGELYKVSGDARHAKMARRCLRACRATPGEPSGVIGAYSGLAGLLYADVRISACLGTAGSPVWRRRLEAVKEMVDRDRRFDVVGGAAGAAIVALRVGRFAPELTEISLEVANACADHLLAYADRGQDRPGRTMPLRGSAVRGLSHGSCGIAWALSEVWRETGRADLLDAIEAALDFENDASAESPTLTEASMAWCYGPPGLLLSRRKVAEAGVPVERISGHNDAEALAEIISRNGRGGSHCLCHGSLGNAEVLRCCGVEFEGRAQAILSAALEERRRAGGWRCGLDFPTPGLMTGSAGIGLHLLRAMHPKIPSVLALDLPEGAQKVRAPTGRRALS